MMYILDNGGLVIIIENSWFINKLYLNISESDIVKIFSRHIKFNELLP